MVSGGVGSCNSVSVGGVGNNSGSSSTSTSAVVGDGGGRMANPKGVAKARRLGRFLFFFFVWVLVESARNKFWPCTDLFSLIGWFKRCGLRGCRKLQQSFRGRSG